jgi:hypothetical protein
LGVGNNRIHTRDCLGEARQCKPAVRWRGITRRGGSKAAWAKVAHGMLEMEKIACGRCIKSSRGVVLDGPRRGGATEGE